MPCIINIETSTKVCSAAVTIDGTVALQKVSYEGPSHASLLGGYVKDLMQFLKDNHITPEALAVSSGPGSYTGLRIGVSMAKGLCFGMEIPLISVTTTELMTVGVMFDDTVPEEALLCPMIDARRMEVYTSIYDRALNEILPLGAYIIGEESFKEILEKHKVVFFGDGSEKCKNVIKHPNAMFLPDIVPLASNMLPLSERAFRSGTFQDVAYFQPEYIKEFQATIPKNKVINPGL